MMKLRPYQEEALQAIASELDNGVSKQLLVLPTGAGKTVVFSQIPKRINGKCLVLAHREELLLQAKEKMEAINPDLKVQIEQASLHADQDADVVIASVPTLGRKESTRITKFDRDFFDAVIVDEAHRAGAESYHRVLNYFTPKLRLGVTATPQRGDNVRLLDIFDKIVYFRTINDMINEEYLVDLVGYRIDTTTDIGNVATRTGDYAVGELEEAVNNEERNNLAVSAYEEIAPNKKAIVFCAGVDHAYSMAVEFNKRGWTAKAIVGTTDKEERSQALVDYSEGKIKVLCGANIFIEGFDEPSIEVVILARPTKSPVLLTQAVGRGMRLHEGKTECIVLDLCDVTKDKRPLGLPTLMGLPPDFDTEGKPLSEVYDEYKALEEEAPEEAARARSLDDIEKAWQRIDLFMPPPVNEELLEFSKYIWMETTSDQYVLNLNNQERITISGDALGQYTVTLKHRANNKDYLLGVVDSMEEAFFRSDKWVSNFRAEQVKLIDATAEWRTDPPTDKQMKWLKKFNVPIVDGLSKGDAARILDKMFAENPKPKKPKWLEEKIRNSQ